MSRPRLDPLPSPAPPRARRVAVATPGRSGPLAGFAILGVRARPWARRKMPGDPEHAAQRADHLLDPEFGLHPVNLFAKGWPSRFNVSEFANPPRLIRFPGQRPTGHAGIDARVRPEPLVPEG